MGNARARGTYAERVAQAIGGELSPHTPKVVTRSIYADDEPVVPGFLRVWASMCRVPKGPRSYSRRIKFGRAADSKA